MHHHPTTPTLPPPPYPLPPPQALGLRLLQKVHGFHSLATHSRLGFPSLELFVPLPCHLTVNDLLKTLEET